MNPARPLARSLVLAFTFGIVGASAWAAKTDEHQAHHPAGDASAPAFKAIPGKPSADMTRMDAQMMTMGAMHDRMMAAKTPEERNALMSEHMKTMQEGMAMMKGMSTQGMGGMKGDMAPRHQTMENRIEMMQSMMQMMMDRLPDAPAN